MTRHQVTVCSALIAVGFACAPAASVPVQAAPPASAVPVPGTCVPCTLIRKPGSIAISADATIANTRGCFRSCYQHGLNGDPEMQGKIVVGAEVSPNGDVGCAMVESNVGLSDTVATCIVGCVQTARFEPPGETGLCLKVPVTFRKVN